MVKRLDMIRILVFLGSWYKLTYLGKAVIMNMLTALPSTISMTIYGVVNFVIGFIITAGFVAVIHHFVASAVENVAAGTFDIGGLPKVITVPFVLFLSTAFGFGLGTNFYYSCTCRYCNFFTILFLFFGSFSCFSRHIFKLFFLQL